MVKENILLWKKQDILYFYFKKKTLILGLFEEGRFYLFIYLFFKGEHFKRREKVFKMIFKKKKFVFENNF